MSRWQQWLDFAQGLFSWCDRFGRELHQLGAGIAVLILLCSAAGEASAAGAPSLRFEPVASLNADSPSAFLQDSQGFIWMGSSMGLYRHDGYRTIHYRHDATVRDSLPADAVSALLEDKHGRLWIGTRDGLARFEPQTGHFTTFFPPPDADGNQQNRIIKSIQGDGEGGMWLATRGGLLHFDPETRQFRSYRHDPKFSGSLPNDNVSVLAQDATGGLWVGTWPSGLAYLPKDSDRFQGFAIDRTRDSRKLPSNPRALFVDSRQRLWIGTDSGLFLREPGTPWNSLRRIASPSNVGEFRVFNIYQDAARTFWISTDEGLLRWDEEHQSLQRYIHRLDDVHSLPGNGVSVAFVDRTQTLWVGTLGSGISRSDLAANGIEHIIPQGIASEIFRSGNLVLCIAEDGHGNLWFGGTDGLALINPGERQLIRSLRHEPGKADGLGSNTIYGLHQEADGTLWMATSKGLDRLDPHDGRIRGRYFDGPGNNSINAIVPGRADVLWLGTAGGVIRFAKRNGAFQVFSHETSNPLSLGPGANAILLEDDAGRVWIGGGMEAGQRGLDILDPATGRVEHYRHDPKDESSLSSDIVTSLHADAHGVIWLGTPDGLNRAVRTVDGGIRFVRYATGNYISSIQTDLDNRLWAKTPSGLLRFDPKTGEVATYRTTDGALDGTPLDKSGFRGRDGKLYFGGLRGVTVVEPDVIRQNTTPPQVAITDIIVFNQSIANQPASEDIQLEGPTSAPRHLRLSWPTTTFSIEFAALHFADPPLNRFIYRLDGFDGDWQRGDAGHDVATYTNLDPGDYVFRVRAASKNGVWSDAEVRLPITITPPVWRTSQFQIALLVGLGILIVLTYRWRVSRLTQKQLRLEALVDERTRQLVDKEQAKTRFLASASHDLRQPLQAMTLFVATLKGSGLTEKQDELVRFLEASIAALRGLLNSLLDISRLDAGAIVPVRQAVSLNELMESVTLELSPLAVEKKIRFKLFCPQREVILHTDPQLFKLVLQNLVSNAIKYTQEGGVLFAARVWGEEVSIQIWDSGIGIGDDDKTRIFDEFYQVKNRHRDRNQGLGLGLSIVKRTLELLDVPLDFRSSIGKGTVFKLRCPVVPQQAPARAVRAPERSVDPACFSGKRFIVVEDDIEAAGGLRSWLQSIGGEVIVYPCAETALADATVVHTGDYYISDFGLPGSVNGVEFLERIRTGSTAPCVLVTGDTSSEFIKRKEEFDIKVLFKPIVPEQLLEALSA